MKNLIFILFTFFGIISLAQDTLQFSYVNSIEYNFRVPIKQNNSNINTFSIMHESILFVGSINNNSFFIGPQISYLNGFLYDPIEKINHINYGLNFGYERKFPIIFSKNGFEFTTRLSFSIYEISKIDYPLGFTDEIQTRKTILENNLYVGLKKSLNPNFYVYTGFGFGSTNGFFLMINSFMLASTFGFGFQF